jgi:hypothetical protein
MMPSMLNWAGASVGIKSALAATKAKAAEIVSDDLVSADLPVPGIELSRAKPAKAPLLNRVCLMNRLSAIEQSVPVKLTPTYWPHW